jgi:F0F1-type ATP synthase membrane subunit b/b'
VEFSLQAATKVIEKNVDSEDNRRLIKETVAEIGKS